MSGKVLVSCLAFFCLLAFSAEGLGATRAAAPQKPQKPLRPQQSPQFPQTARVSTRLDVSTSTEKPLPLWEVRTAPVAMLASWMTLDFSYRFNEHFATGPALVSYNAEGRGNMLMPTYKGNAFGWNATYYIRSVQRRWTPYLSTHAYYESYSAYSHSSTGHDERVGFRGQAAFGWQAKAGIVNFLAGAGPEVRSHSVKKVKDSEYGQGETETTDSSVLPFLEFKIGLEF